MSSVKHGKSMITGYAASPCSFCGQKVNRGAYWMADGESGATVCVRCLLDGGAIGSLLGDTARDAKELRRFLERLESKAWYALALRVKAE